MTVAHTLKRLIELGSGGIKYLDVWHITAYYFPTEKI